MGTISNAWRLVGVALGCVLVSAQACSGDEGSPESGAAEEADASLGEGASELALVLSLSRADPALERFLGVTARGFETAGDTFTSPGWRGVGAGPSRIAARLSSSAGAPYHVGLSPKPEAAIELVRDGARESEGQLHEGRALFADAYPSTDLVAVATMERYEELFLLRAPSAPVRFSYRFVLPRAIPRVTEQPDGALLFLDASDQPAIRLAKPFALDARSERRDASLRVEGDRIVLELDPAGLEYPVLLDPEWRVASWALAATTTGPPARALHALAWNGTNVLLHGGNGLPGGAQNDTWIWNGTSWSGPAVGGPAARKTHAMAYDAARGEVVLFGGADGANNPLFDTWLWKAGSWAQACTTCTADVDRPSARFGHGMSYDTVRQKVLLFGGNPGSGSSNEFWEWDGALNKWSKRCAGAGCAAAGVARTLHGQAYDVQNARTVIFGGTDGTVKGDTLLYNSATDSLAAGASMAVRYRAGMTYDSVRRRVILFGGRDTGAVLGDTWEWDGTAWTALNQAAGSASPSARENSPLAFDPVRKRVVLVNGDEAVNPDDQETWTMFVRGDQCSAGTTCDTGFCVDGVCCTTASCGTCQRCDMGNLDDAGLVTSGVCEKVLNAEDVGTCSGTNICDGSGNCKKKNGQGCTLGTECASGNCVDGTCCEVSACSVTACRSCANAGGTCSTLVTNQDDDNCSGANTCDASGNCKKKNGQTCSSGAECATGNCIDGTCCTNNCPTACRSCANAAGTCTSIVTSQDDDNCNGNNTCDAAGSCKKKSGQTCALGSDCATGNCIDLTCCQSTCTTPCRSCANASGACTTVVASQDDNNCNGANTCDASGNCKKKSGQTCSSGAECATGNCIDGTCCADTCTTPCRSCANASGSCTTLVTNQEDGAACSGSNTCDGSGTCKKKNGQTCTLGTECATGNCVDGTCCADTCATPCRSCANSAGTCTTVVANQDDNNCGGVTSTCDATGSCKKKTGQSCTAGSECAGGNCADTYCCDSACSGGCDVCSAALGATANGYCTVKGAGSSGQCGAYKCGGSAACPTTCSSDAACEGTHYCSGNACVPKLGLGTTCAGANECASGHCVDGVCCDGTCTGKCMACAAANKADDSLANSGKCGAAKQGTNPGNQCVLSTDPCGDQASCSGTPGQCAKGPFGKSCGPSTCQNGTVNGKVCDGTGTCIDQTNAQCTPYVCKGSACSSPCAVDAECISTHYCSSGICVAKSDNGAACNSASPGTCKSGFCVDGVCCDSPCAGQCQACAEQGSEGQCKVVSGDPRTPRPACLGTAPDKCKGACDGANPTACTYPAAGTACKDAACTGDVSQPAGACDGVGLCALPATKNCLPYGCNATSGDCNASCTSDTDCAQGAKCDTTQSKCAVATATCKDSTTLQLPNGQSESCIPYKCVGGACQQQCSTANDCASGYTCQGKACVAEEGGTDSGAGGGGTTGSGASGGAPPGGSSTGGKKSDSGDDGGCGCRVPASNGSSHAYWLGALALAALRRRRARGAA